MLHYIACISIAYFLALYLNTRFPTYFTAIWSSGVATIAGLVAGSFIVLGALNLLGIPINHNALPKAVGQAFIWSIVGTIAGVYYGRKNAKSKSIASSPRISNLDQTLDSTEPQNFDQIYKKIAEEIESKKYDRGLLTRAIAEGGGDREKAKSIYIKLRAIELDSEIKRQSKQDKIRKKAKQKAAQSNLLNNIGKYVYGFIFLFSVIGIISTILLLAIEDTSYFALLPIVLWAPVAIFTYRKMMMNYVLSKKPSPNTHVRCPDCRELILKESKTCSYCGCRLIPQ